MDIPDHLRHLSRYKTGDAWLTALPETLSELCVKWDLRVGEPFSGASVSYTVPALRGEQQLVLKIQWPHEECVHEADALRVWGGDGAVRLFDHDSQRHALLLEACVPGTTVADQETVDPMAVLTDILPRLWKSAGAPFKSLKEEADEWLSNLYENWEAVGKPCDKHLVDAAAAWLTDLKDDQGEQVLLHQDLHGYNILAAGDRGWLAIDPKPLTGERAFGPAPAIRSFEFGHSKEQAIYRLDRLSSELSLDRQRVLGWTVGQTIAWSFDSIHAHRHFDTVRWLLESE